MKIGLWCNPKVRLCSSWAEIERLVILSVICGTQTRAAFLTNVCNIRPTFGRGIMVKSIFWVHVINDTHSRWKWVLFQRPVHLLKIFIKNVQWRIASESLQYSVCTIYCCSRIWYCSKQVAEAVAIMRFFKIIKLFPYDRNVLLLYIRKKGYISFSI